MNVLVATAGTAAVYAGCVRLQRALGGPALANPTLCTILVVAAALPLLGIPVAAYEAAAWPLVLLLAPATVALGVPLAANLAAVRRHAVAIAAGVLAGTLLSAALGSACVRLLGGGLPLARTMIPKAATTPIAMAVAERIGGVVPLAATFAIASGLLTALLMRPLLRAVGVRDAAATGLAAGVAGSGIGAAAAARLGAREAAFAAMGVGLTGLATALLAPFLRMLLTG